MRVPRKPKKETAPKNPNMVKTSNKLIGEIENRDLYDSDEGVLELDKEKLFGGAAYDNNMEMLGQNLDFGEVKREKKQMDLLFNKIQNKKQQREDPSSVE